MPISRVEVISGIDGFVRDVHVTEGDIVELGALIAELDRTELEKLVRRREAELSEAENELAVLERGSRPEEVARAKRLVESRRQSARVALAQRQRLTDLYARKFASSDEVSAAEIKYVEAASQVAEAQADLKILQAGARPEDIARRAAVVEAKRIDLSIAKGQLGATRLLAPSAGIVIGDMHAAKHRHLTVGESLCQIANLTKMRAVARLDESALAHVKPGAEVSLKIVSQPNRVFSSKVTFVSPAIEKVDGSRHFRVETELDNPERLLRPNESGYLKVHTGSRSLWISFINYVSAKTRTVFVF